MIDSLLKRIFGSKPVEPKYEIPDRWWNPEAEEWVELDPQ